MKRFLGLLVIAFLGLSLLVFIAGVTFADDECPLTGNTYTFEAENIQYELSGFVCAVGPGCRGDCDLWWGDFDTGPLWHGQLPFICEPDGNVIITINQIKIPCILNSQGNLECLTTDISGFYCIQLGEKTWCLPKKSGKFQFDLK